MNYTFSDKRDIAGAFPISSRRANDGDWKLFDIHDDVSETLSARSRPIFPQDEDEMREVPKKSKRFWESKGRKQNRELEPKNEEQESERQSEEHGESHADKSLDQSGVFRREQVEEQGQKTVERGESQEEKTLGDQSKVRAREKIEKGQGPDEHEESQESKTANQSEVPGQGQAEQEPEEHKESQEDKTPKQSELPEREQVEEQEHEEHEEVPEMQFWESKGRKQVEQNESSRLGLLNRRRRNAVENTWNDDLIIP